MLNEAECEMTESNQPSPLTVYLSGDEALAVIAGPLRLDNCQAIRAELAQAFRPPVKTLYLDMRSMTELDSAGLGVLVGLHMTARKNKIDLRLLSPQMHQMRLLQTTRLDAILTVIGGVEGDAIRQRLADDSRNLMPREETQF